MVQCAVGPACGSYPDNLAQKLLTVEQDGADEAWRQEHTFLSSTGTMGEDAPPSLEYIQAKDLFPQKELVKEDESLQVPFPVLQGEGVEYLGRAVDAIIAMSNYRLHIKFKDSIINVPLRLIETAESRDMFQLHIICKDSKVVRCHFSTFKQCQEWLKRLTRAIAHPSRLEDLFALAYHAWCLGGSADDEEQHVHLCRPGDHVRQRMEVEVLRMGYDMQNAWRVSDINANYKLCSSYPQKLLVPVWITDKELDSVASFRSWKRIPVVVYRHQRNGAVIARCSQPEISWWGWRNTEDEYLVTSIAKACHLNPSSRTAGGPPSRPRTESGDTCDSDFDSSLTACPGPDASTVPQKLLILDARSYTAAVANRAKGGGCECEEYYPNCEVMFMGMANIHSIRNSFQSLRAVCTQIPDPGNWLSALESTRWLQHLSVMLKAATLVCSAVEREGRPVLVHCSDGWDRTPQIVALAKVLLDPYYRTLEGFQVLVETEWLDFGHKFGDRCGHHENADDASEQCPVFLQWLDCVHQLLKQFPCLFEFNEAFLVKLVQHTYSCLYGTFLCNNGRERELRNISNRTCSVWSLLRSGNKNFQNFLYIPSHDTVLQPVCHTRALQLWTAVYLPTTSPCTAAEDSMELYLSPSAQGEEFTSRSLDRLPKTRSMDNLVSACENGVALTRTSSDPNLNKHCPDTRPALEPKSALGVSVAHSPNSSDEHTRDSEEAEEEAKEEPGLGPGSHAPPTLPESSGLTKNCNTVEEACLTTQPLPTLHCSATQDETLCTTQPLPAPHQAVPLEESSVSPAIPWGTQAKSRTHDCMLSPSARSGRLQHSGPGLEKPLVVSPEPTKGLPEEGEARTGTPREERDDAESNGKTASLGRGQPECSRLARRPVAQSQLSDFTLLGSHWESVQGLVKSACGTEAGLCRALQPGLQGRRLAGRLLRAQGVTPGSGACCRREGIRSSGSPVHSGWLSAIKSSGYATLCSSLRQPLPAAASPPPLPGPTYLDDDGLPVPLDAVQQRLRQIEAGYKQEVEVLRWQVQQLQMRLESKQFCRPPSEPDVDYEDDDITCVRESDSSDQEGSLSDHSEDRFSEGSWDRVEPKDTEVSVPACLFQVTRWVPDHMASHCFNCDCEFWIAKRRHHCRNCGNVFCKDCCHLKLPIPDQQLYDPVLVCNSCYDLLQESRTREIRIQQLKKPIATASS
ncbi:phosphatidylinositol-3,5-bisphosphate 3-phosphatase MTMR4 isoform X4 [Paramormyrops kingsleyae]|uniref:phosphatidylinositol-3,5-bisphosphate 3-phosphatase MTMR4 isoform X4 n=1 Tax=Paramormyrops kingsleyae TaxID=1676925 RepID=UPI000CD65FBC|nr:myotubularin-related protein 4 isoform X4 [Paramormyrops kingsleyae]